MADAAGYAGYLGAIVLEGVPVALNAGDHR